MTPDERVNEFVETMMSVDLAASPVIAPSARAPRETCPECGGSGKFAAVSEREERTPDTDAHEASYITNQARAGTAFPRETWGDDDRTVIWWNEESGDTMIGCLEDIEELECEGTAYPPGFFTHFTRIVNPVFPARSSEQETSTP